MHEIKWIKSKILVQTGGGHPTLFAFCIAICMGLKQLTGGEIVFRPGHVAGQWYTLRRGLRFFPHRGMIGTYEKE